MATGIEGLEFKDETEIINNGNKTNDSSNWLTSTLLVFSWLELIASIVLAFTCGLEDFEFDPITFFCCLVGGIIGFVIFQVLAVCVKAANKYLNN